MTRGSYGIFSLESIISYRDFSSAYISGTHKKSPFHYPLSNHPLGINVSKTGTHQYPTQIYRYSDISKALKYNRVKFIGLITITIPPKYYPLDRHSTPTMSLLYQIYKIYAKLASYPSGACAVLTPPLTARVFQYCLVKILSNTQFSVNTKSYVSCSSSSPNPIYILSTKLFTSLKL